MNKTGGFLNGFVALQSNNHLQLLLIVCRSAWYVHVAHLIFQMLKC